MNDYSVEITRSVEKDLENLGHLREEAVNKLLTLEKRPETKGSSLKGNLKGLLSYKFNLPGAGAFRAIYYIKDEKNVCLIIIIGSRENIYLQAHRRYQYLKKQGLID